MKKARARKTAAKDKSVQDSVIWRGQKFPIQKISSNGLLFGPVPLPPSVDDHVQMRVVLRERRKLEFAVSGRVIAERDGVIACRYWAERREDAAIVQLLYAARERVDVLMEWVGQGGAGGPILATRGLIPKHFT